MALFETRYLRNIRLANLARLWAMSSNSRVVARKLEATHILAEPGASAVSYREVNFHCSTTVRAASFDRVLNGPIEIVEKETAGVPVGAVTGEAKKDLLEAVLATDICKQPNLHSNARSVAHIHIVDRRSCPLLNLGHHKIRLPNQGHVERHH